MNGDTIGTSQRRDFAGNMFKRTRPTSSLDDFYFYNADDRMVRVDMLEGIESVSQFEYDAMGRRLISTDNDDNKTLYYYDGIRVILEKTKPSGSGMWSTSQVYTLQEGAIGFIASSRDTATGDDTWYHYNRIGTVMNLTDATGAVTATYDPPRRTFSQDAFGNVLSGSSDGFHLTTKRHYSDIGLYYFYQRWYEPQLGRFTQKDKIAFLNRYIYCLNNPTNFVDANGAWPKSKPKDPSEVQREIDFVKDSCGLRSGGTLDMASEIACCSALKELMDASWTKVPWWADFLFGSPHTNAKQCRERCACESVGNRTGSKVVEDFAKCMGKYSTTLGYLSPFPGTPMPGLN